ncbi:MAG: hypothetical protein JXN64_09355 [Spirochaetes bacterium]|nr:hypothetical protein [Spirochaetota bacterium]
MIKHFCIITLAVLLIYGCDSRAKNDASEDNKTSGETPAPVPGITASVDRNKTHVGDLINLSLKYFIPEGSTYAPDTDLTGIEGLSIADKKSAKGEITFVILVDKTESFIIGPVKLSFKDSKGVLNIIQSEALSIEVLSNLGNKPAEAQLKPLMEIIPTYPFILRIIPWVIAGLLLIALAAGIYYRIKIQCKKNLTSKDIKPPHVIAKEEIEKLKALNLIDKGEYKEFYFRFSEILRQYIEKLRGFPAAELTTEEIARRIKEERDRKLLPILREADMVKFADAIPVKAKNEEDIRAALEYIKATTPVPTAAGDLK